MPRYPVDRATNFIVEDESWTVVEYDHTSVPGVIYLSLTEGKVNSIYDDLQENIADTDKIANYNLLVPDLDQMFVVGDEINPLFTVTKNGKPIEVEVDYIPINKQVAKFVGGKLMAVGEGTTDIYVQLKEYPSIQKTLQITVGTTVQEFAAYIEGNAKLRLDRSSTYELKGTSDIDGEVVFTLSNDLAVITQVEGATCVIKANAKNLLGTITLTAAYQGKEYTKEIELIPLW